ncbi:MAG: histidine kinase N-terminal 7TM domain-containing protein [Haloquadratum sp.]|nr:histidine kinase N-terminal 7TM domain-containing protein [Haloquadratum sp.]
MASWQAPPVLWLFVLASVASSVIGSYAVWYVLNRERRRRVVMVAAITIPIAVWVAMAALRVASADLATKTLWYRLEFVGHAWLPSMFVVLVLDYVAPARITRRLWAVLLAIPIATIALAVGSPPGVFIDTVLVDAGGGYTALEQQLTPLFTLHVLWAGGATVAMTAAIGWAVLRRRIPRFIGVIFGIAPLIPLAVFTLRGAGVYPPGGTGFDLTPAAIAVTMVIDIVVIFRHRVFDRVHTGRSQALAAHAAGYLLVHESGRIVDANAAAAEFVGAPDRTALLADDIGAYLPELPAATGDHRLTLGARTVVVERTTIRGVGQTSGYALLLTEVTELARRERQLTQYAALIERLPVGVYRIDPDAEPPLRYANPTLVQMLGAESLGALQAAAIPQLYDPAAAVEAGARVREETLELERVDGTRFWAHLSEIRVEADGARSIEGSVVDVSEQKATEAALASSGDELRRERDQTATLQQLLMATTPIDEVAATVAAIARDRTTAAAVWVLDDDGTTVLATAGDDGADRAGVTAVAQEAISAMVPQTVSDGGAGPSLVAVPATYEGVSHGALVACEPGPAATAALTTLAQTVAFVQQRQQVRSVLTEETVLRLVIELTDPAHPLVAMRAAMPADHTGALEVTTTRPAAEAAGVASLLVTAPDAAMAQAFAAAGSQVAGVVSAEEIDGADGRPLVHVRTTAPTVGATIRAHAGLITTYTVSAAGLRIEAELPRRTLAADVLADLRTDWPAASLRSKRTQTPEATPPPTVAGFSDHQAEVLAVATKMGFFERPQRATGADVAAVVGVSRSTVMYHLRAAEQELFSTLFADREP